ncbi:MAG: tetratricopeptide repeat protein [bacterium]|nr:tetratricopeptide repeat protein [bacterium]
MPSHAPPVTATTNRLPFDALSPAKFEELCLWLIRREGYKRVEYLGEAGSEQGRDLVAWKDDRRFAFQCKRVRRFNASDGKREIKKIRTLADEDQPDELVFLVSRAVRAAARKEIRKAWGYEDTCHFWAGGELNERVNRYAHLREHFFHLPPFEPQPRTKPWNAPHSRNPYFTGRGDTLGALRRQLTEERTVALGQIQAISGLGGVGKTQTALEYVWRHRADYDAVLWTRAETEEELVTGFVEIACVLSIPQAESDDQAETVAAVRRWLEEHDGWLLVFDNADKPELVKTYLPKSPRGHVLLTSRARSFGVLGIRRPVRMEVLPPEEALEFLLERTERQGEVESSAAAELAEELGYLPLALEQAGAYLEAQKARFEDYLASYRNLHLGVLERGAPRQYPKSVATTWSLNVDQVKATSPASAEILQLSAFLAPDRIPEEILLKGAPELGPVLGAALEKAADDPLVVSELLAPLVGYSLIDRDAEDRTWSVHRMVQAVTKQRLGGVKKGLWAKRCVRALDRVFPEAELTSLAKCARLSSHVLAATRSVQPRAWASEQGCRLLDKAGRYSWARGQYRDARAFLERELKIRKKKSGREHPDTVSSLNNLAALYRDQGDYKRAAPLLDRALKILARLVGPENPFVATILSNRASLYRAQGEYSRAAALHEHTLKIRERVLGPEHPDVAESLNNLAIAYSALGRDRQAAPLHERALEIWEKVLEPEHPKVAAALSNLAILYRAQGEYSQAAALHERALEIREKVLGPEHPEVAQSLNNLAVVYSALGKDRQAAPLHERALEIRQKVLGPEHPDIAQSLDNLATLYRAQGEYSQAAAHYEQALEILEKVLGPQHPKVAETLNSLASLYRAQSRYEEAEELFQSAVAITEPALGPSHPALAGPLGNLANLYRAQRRYAEAEPLYQRSIQILEKALGPDHLRIAQPLENYSHLLRKTKRRREARVMKKRVKAIRKAHARREDAFKSSEKND